MHFFLIPSPDIQCVKWSNCKSTMADPHQVSLHISAPLTDLAWRSGLQNDLIPVPLCSSSNELSAVVAISHVHNGQSIGFYYTLIYHKSWMREGGRVIHSKTMHPQCINRKSVCLQLFSWMFLHLGHYFMQARKTNRSESNHETSNKKTAQCKTFKIGIRETKPFQIPHVMTFFLFFFFPTNFSIAWSLFSMLNNVQTKRTWTFVETMNKAILIPSKIQSNAIS